MKTGLKMGGVKNVTVLTLGVSFWGENVTVFLDTLISGRIWGVRFFENVTGGEFVRIWDACFWGLNAYNF